MQSLFFLSSWPFLMQSLFFFKSLAFHIEVMLALSKLVLSLNCMVFRVNCFIKIIILHAFTGSVLLDELLRMPQDVVTKAI